MQEIIKHDRVRTGEALPAARAKPAAKAPRHERGVRLIRVDGRAHSIELTCDCGQVSVIELEYEADAPQASPATGEVETPDSDSEVTS